jgi:N utilization substance protein A
VKEVRFHEVEGVAEVVVPDHQLSLAIGREGQNARLAARLTGWRIDIKSETQILDEENAYADGDWAEGEWVTDADTGEQTWVPADGSEAMTADDWATAAEEGVGEENPEQDSVADESEIDTALEESSSAEETTEEGLVEETEGNESPTDADEEQETVTEEEEQSNN